MRNLRWDLEKSRKLKRDRGVSFEEIIRSKLITALRHPKRSNQRLLLFEHNDYIWVVPFVQKGNEYFLKTLFPSRKYTRIWEKGEF